MRSFGYPVVFDVSRGLPVARGPATASRPGRPNSSTRLAPAGVAAGVDGVFLEIGERSVEGEERRANALALDRLDGLLGLLTRIDAARRDAA